MTNKLNKCGYCKAENNDLNRWGFCKDIQQCDRNKTNIEDIK